MPGYATWAGTIALQTANAPTVIGVDGGTLNLTGVISGTSDLTKIGGGSLALLTNNTYTGQTNVAVGNVNLGSTSGLGTIAGGTIVSSGATLVLNAGSPFNGELLTLNGTGNGLVGPDDINGESQGGFSTSFGNALQPAGALLEQTGLATWTGNINLNPGTVISLAPTGTGAEGLVMLGQFQNAPGVQGDLIKGGTGDLVLQANNTYTGVTDVNFGAIVLDGSGTLSSTSEINLDGPSVTAPTWPLYNANASITPVIAVSTSSGNFVSTNTGGGLTLDNMAINIPNRIASTIPINSLGATIVNLGSNIPGAVTNESFGTVNLVQGATAIINVNEGGGLAQISITNLNRTPGTTVQFLAQEFQLTTNSLNPALGSPQSQIVIGNYSNGNAPLVNGILPWATVATPGVVNWDLATYGASGITAFASAYTAGGQRYASSWSAPGPDLERQAHVEPIAAWQHDDQLADHRRRDHAHGEQPDPHDRRRHDPGGRQYRQRHDDRHDHRRSGQLRHG